MKRRGFTLIELLAVIVILAIILAIAIPSITNIIEGSQVNALKSDEKMLLKAARTYAGVNDSALPTNIGDTREIALSTLQTNGYINAITAPNDKTTTCNGYVIVTKIGATDYDYTPYLNCENNIGSLATDGLIAHYKFDDFQEPTVNLFRKTDLKQGGTSPYVINYYTGSTATYGYSDPFGTNNAIKFIGGSNPTLRYGVVDGTNTDIVYGETYTFSVYAKLVPGETAPTFFSLEVVDRGGNNFAGQLTSDWKRFELTALHDNTASYGFTDITTNAGSSIYLSQPQVEKKNYATPFVEGTRTATVKDYSGNNHTGTILLSNTPKWLEDSNREGVYYFDGVNDYFDVGTTGSLGLTDNFTLSAWVKFDNTGGVRVGNIIGNYSVIPHFNYEGLTYGIRFYWNSGEVDLSGTTDLRNSWHHVVSVRNRATNRIKVYVDGKLEVEKAAGTNQDITWPLRIGGDFRATPGIPYHGYIDSIRLYSRALNDDEVKQLYNSEK